jgi:DNA-directed RNA polymerase specialized sigma24 family protein
MPFFNTNPSTSIRTAVGKTRITAHEHAPLSCHSSDAELLAATAAKHEWAFDFFVRRYCARVHRFLYRLLADPTQAEHVLECVFVDAYRRPAHYHKNAPVALFRQALELVEQSELGDRKRFKSLHVPANLLTALSKLTSRELAALLLDKFEGFSTCEIGQVLGLNAKAAASVLLRVYSQL